jgi:hypothetical protein
MFIGDIYATLFGDLYTFCCGTGLHIVLKTWIGFLLSPPNCYQCVLACLFHTGSEEAMLTVQQSSYG